MRQRAARSAWRALRPCARPPARTPHLQQRQLPRACEPPRVIEGGGGCAIAVIHAADLRCLLDGCVPLLEPWTKPCTSSRLHGANLRASERRDRLLPDVDLLRACVGVWRCVCS
jgi:hypothetical protein